MRSAMAAMAAMADVTLPAATPLGPFVFSRYHANPAPHRLSSSRRRS